VFCFGQAISRTTFADLFALLSTTYGVGDGALTFNLPDLRGRVVAGQDDMGGSSANRLTNQSGGLDGDTLGATGGAETHTLTSTESAAHQHAGSANFATVGVAGATFGGSGVADKALGDTLLTGSSGGGGAHNNVQPTIVLNYVIKT
jgi:microcystin-dependent protein